ncbi:MDR family oxidoreductase [Aureimonas ureilytica]|uniref:acrylyl-CoA reductase (NADPH) n=1 Tax=Aureimonas ureilytica TaxID=401562 RepID=UPI003CFA6426
MADEFRAIRLQKGEAGAPRVEEAVLTPDDLMEGDVDVAVEATTINYKDALALTGRAPVVRRWPMVPGIDLAGTVAASRSALWREGDKVILNGHGLGETHWGAYAGLARVKAEWLVPLPAPFSAAEAMGIGTAGYTAALCVLALERHGLSPERGPALVTGASGGVGSIAVALLARRGWHVAASTGRPEGADWLRGLGASDILDRADLAGPGKPLGSERWAAGVDSVGSHTLANLLSMTKRDGAVAACGLAGGLDLPASVAPFILRGVALLGVDSVYAAQAERLRAWERLAEDLDPAVLASLVTEIGFADIVPTATALLEGKVRGRVVVTDVGAATRI